VTGWLHYLRGGGWKKSLSGTRHPDFVRKKGAGDLGVGLKGKVKQKRGPIRGLVDGMSMGNKGSSHNNVVEGLRTSEVWFNRDIHPRVSEITPRVRHIRDGVYEPKRGDSGHARGVRAGFFRGRAVGVATGG